MQMKHTGDEQKAMSYSVVELDVKESILCIRSETHIK